VYASAANHTGPLAGCWKSNFSSPGVHTWGSWRWSVYKSPSGGCREIP